MFRAKFLTRTRCLKFCHAYEWTLHVACADVYDRSCKFRPSSSPFLNPKMELNSLKF